MAQHGPEMLDRCQEREKHRDQWQERLDGRMGAMSADIRKIFAGLFGPTEHGGPSLSDRLGALETLRTTQAKASDSHWSKWGIAVSSAVGIIALIVSIVVACRGH